MRNSLKYMALAATVAAFGCGGGSAADTSSGSAAATPSTVKTPKPKVTAEAGVPVSQAPDDGGKSLVVLGNRVIQRSGINRDPFALKPGEKGYETQQETERVLGQTGGFSVEFTPPEPKPEEAPRILQPQPYRRLSGVVVGDSVMALIDMGDGTSTLIRPGMTLPPPNSEWRVVSIDEEKAVLRRNGNILPHQVTVRLESPPSNMSGGSNGVPGGGAPGGPPGRTGGGKPSVGAGGAGGGFRGASD